LKFSADPSKIGDVVSVAPNAAKESYSKFYRRLFDHEANGFLSGGRRFLIGGAMAVDVIALNTAYLDQAPDAFQGPGFVGHEQLEAAAKAMEWNVQINPDHPRAVRIVVLHHHLVPVTFRPVPKIGYKASVLWDAEAVVRWLVEHRVDLVLHGHMHDPFIEG